jgi:hypothetical protein
MQSAAVEARFKRFCVIGAATGRGFSGACAVALALGFGGSVTAQNPNPADLAARMTGAWKLNAELSPDVVAPGRGRGRFAPALALSLAPAAFQRGGRGGGGGGGGGGGVEMPEPTAGELAAQAALTVLQQVPTELTIEATAAEITFIEPRGTRTFKIDGKTASMDVPGGTLKMKSRWDRGTLRQEFSSTQRTLRRSWHLDGNDRLVLTQRVESLTFNSKDSTVLFDRR